MTTKIVNMTFVILVTPKAGAKHEPNESVGGFVEQKLTLSCNVRHDIIQNNYCYEASHIFSAT